VQDVEPFIEWLRTKGLTDDAQLSAYRRFVAEIGAQPSLSAALRAAEEEGKPAKHIANLRAVAARMAEFDSMRDAPAIPAAARTPGLEVEPRQPARGGLDVGPRPPAPVVERHLARGGGLEVEASQPRSVPAAMQRDMGDRRKGCICSKRYDLYLDDDFGALARLFGGGIGIGTIILIRLVGILGALAIALGFAGMGGLITILSICMRCEGCRRRVQDLDPDERARVRKGRGRVIVLTLIFIVGALICAAAWWNLVKAPPRQHF
jgi:hypothetical protein